MEQDKVLHILKSVQLLPIDFLQNNNVECEYIREFKMFHPIMGWVKVESYYLPIFNLYKWQLTK